MNKQLWIGFAEVRPLPGCALLEEARGAYVHVMAWANTSEEFALAVSSRMYELALEIVDLREVEPWAIRSSGDDPIRDEFFEMADRANADLSLVVFGRFHAWFQDQPIGENKRSAINPLPSEKNARAAEPHPPRPAKPGPENGH